MRHACLFMVLSSLLFAGSTPAEAQSRRRCRTCDRDPDRVHVIVRDRQRAYDRYDRGYTRGRQLSLMVGVLDSDFAGDENFPMAALRADWRLSRFVRSEVDATYAVGELEFGPTTTPGAPSGDVNTSLFTATVGIQGELPIPFVRPYAGAAVGLFGRFDEKGAGGERFVRTTTAFPVGVRIRFSQRLALRAEARFRFDADPDGATAGNVEQTAGLSFTF
jgi:hypothetical protein